MDTHLADDREADAACADVEPEDTNEKIETRDQDCSDAGDATGDDGAMVDRRRLESLHRRAYSLDREGVDVDARSVSISLSSDAPVERSFGTEILEHSAAAIDLEFLGSGRAPLLLDHDMRQQIGVIEEVLIDSDARKTRAKVRFGRGALADEVFTDVVDGIRANVSVGYRIDEMSKDEGEDGTVFTATRWTPMEASIVSIPADQTVGVGRSASVETVPKEEIHMEHETKVDINVDEVRAEAAADARAEYAKSTGEILALGAKHNRRDLAESAIGKGHSVEQFRGELLDVIGDAKPLEVADSNIGMSHSEVRQFSFQRAMNARAGRMGIGFAL